MIIGGLRWIGFAWIAIVVAFGVWRGFQTAFLHVPEGSLDNIYVLVLIAAPGVGMVALANRFNRPAEQK